MPQRQRVPRSLLVMMFLFIVGVVAVSEQDVWNWIVKILGGVMFIGFVMNIWRSRLRIAPEWVLYVVFLVWALAAVPVVKGPQVFWVKYQTLVMVCMLLLVLINLAQYRSVLTLAVFAFLLGAVILGGMAFLSGGFIRPGGAAYGTYEDASETASYARLSWGMNPNGFGRMMVMGSYCVGYLWMVVPRRRRLFRLGVLLPVVLFLIAACIYSGSRFSILGIGFGTLAFFFWGYRSEMKRNPMTVVYALVALMLLFAFALRVGENTLGFRRMKRTAEMLTGGETRGGGQSRIHIYKNISKVFLDNVIVGVGLDNYRFHDPRGKVAHSEYGAIACGTGLPGFVIYFSIWGVMWWRSGQMSKRSSDPIDNRIGGVFRGLLATLLLFGLGAPMYMTKWAWALLGVFIGYGVTSQENQRALEQAQMAWYQQQWYAAQAQWRASRRQHLAQQQRQDAAESS